MIISIEREELRSLHQENNPEIRYELYEVNFGWAVQNQGNTLIITDNGKKIMEFTSAHEYFDKRKPNEYPTTD